MLPERTVLERIVVSSRDLLRLLAKPFSAAATFRGGQDLAAALGSGRGANRRSSVGFPNCAGDMIPPAGRYREGRAGAVSHGCACETGLMGEQRSRRATLDLADADLEGLLARAAMLAER